MEGKQEVKQELVRAGRRKKPLPEAGMASSVTWSPGKGCGDPFIEVGK